MTESLENKCDILGELWMKYRKEVDFQGFVNYNDIGLPLAFMVSEGIVEDPKEIAQSFIFEAYDMLVQALKIEDKEYKSLDEMFAAAGFES